MAGLYAYESEGRVVIERIMKGKKKAGWISVKDKDLPSRDLRNAWVLVDGAVTVDAEKAEECRREAVRASRRAEYPPIADQLDLIMNWLSTETEFSIPKDLKSMACACMSVKSRHPFT